MSPARELSFGTGREVTSLQTPARGLMRASDPGGAQMEGDCVPGATAVRADTQ